MKTVLGSVFRRGGIFVILSLGFFSGLATNFSRGGISALSLGADVPKILVDQAKPVSELGGQLSFAPMLKKVSPAIVTVFSSKKVRVPDFSENPFFSDPFFRRYFNVPDGAFGSGRHGSQPREFGQQTGLGSGVIVSKNGYIITNHHVIAVADEIQVAVSGTKKHYLAQLIGTDPQTDLAVLKVDLDHAVEPVSFADSEKVEVGDVVLALGNPFGIGQTVTSGIVSALGRNLPGSELAQSDLVGQFIQTDAAINPGNSGGALVDGQGRLVGVNSAILSQSGGNIGIGFAIPSNLVHSVFDQIVKNGKVTRSFLGVAVREADQANGVEIANVYVDSPAAQAGLKQGDIILQVDGHDVDSPHGLRSRVSQIQPGKESRLSVLRDGKRQELKVILQAQKSS